MPIIELDMLIAFVNPEDRLHRYTDELFKNVASGKNVKIK